MHASIYRPPVDTGPLRSEISQLVCVEQRQMQKDNKNKGKITENMASTIVQIIV